MSEPLAALLGDLADETAELLAVLEPLEADSWSAPTPARGWDVADQIAHLAYFDAMAVLAVRDAPAFVQVRDALVAGGPDFPDRAVLEHRGTSPARLVSWFRDGREALLSTLADIPADGRVSWFGPSMSVMSCATARLMETWAHGQDVVDALGLDRAPSDRLRHVAHLGVRTRGFSYAVRDRTAPAADVRVELEAPSGRTWTWGAPEATDRVRGPAVDFCLVVTQRRPVASTALQVSGSVAHEWLELAQAYAGAPALVDPARR